MNKKLSEYSRISLEGLNFIFTNKYFGNLSEIVGDTSNYTKNLDKFLSLAPINKKVIKLKAEHGDKIIDISSISNTKKYKVLKGDSLILNINLATAWIAPADCVIIVIFDKATDIICLIHASRLTIPKNIIPITIQTYLSKTKKSIKSLSAYLSPSIHSSNYVFEPNVANSLFDKSWNKFIKKVDNKIEVDIKARAISDLKIAGIEDISIDSNNTADGNFFSNSEGRINQDLSGRNGFLIYKSS